MSAAAIFANTLPAAPDTVCDARAPAPGAENDAKVFAGLVADEAPADATAVPAPAAKDDATPVSVTDANASTAATDKPRQGLLSSQAALALQQSDKAVVSAEAVAEPVATPAAPVIADASAEVPAAETNAAPAPEPAKADDAAPTQAVQTPMPPIVPTLILQATVAVALVAEASTGATVPDGAQPVEAAPTDTDAPTTPAPSIGAIPAAPPASAFEQAIANASAATTKGEQATNAASADPASTTATAAPTARADATAAASVTDLSAAPPPATAPAPTPVIAEAAAPAAGPIPVAAQPQAAATASTPIIVPTNLSHLSQATLETTVHIAAQITRELKGRSTRFEMGLTPDGLGRVDVSLDIDSGGKLTARLAFDNPLAATELRGKADELRRELTDAGFTIARDGLDFSERQPSSSNGGFDRQQGRAFASASRITADADLSQPAPAAWISLALTPSGVDMKV
ncbi:hypothetical protein BH09PSE1_BH09PSE1_24160 [soil metagenome]